MVYYGQIMAFFKEYKVLWGAALILLGIFLAFFGNNFLKALFFMMATLVTFCACAWLLFFIMAQADANLSETVEWVLFGCCLIPGLIVGYCFYKHQPLGLGLLAAAGGVALGFLLNMTFFIEETW